MTECTDGREDGPGAGQGAFTILHLGGEGLEIGGEPRLGDLSEVVEVDVVHRRRACAVLDTGDALGNVDDHLPQVLQVTTRALTLRSWRYMRSTRPVRNGMRRSSSSTSPMSGSVVSMLKPRPVLDAPRAR